jgi:hypothetical protein
MGKQLEEKEEAEGPHEWGYTQWANSQRRRRRRRSHVSGDGKQTEEEEKAAGQWVLRIERDLVPLDGERADDRDSAHVPRLCPMPVGGKALRVACAARRGLYKQSCATPA